MLHCFPALAAVIARVRSHPCCYMLYCFPHSTPRITHPLPTCNYLRPYNTPTYDDKWNTMERSNAWFVNPIHEQYECGANELASALQDTAIANAGQQKLYEEVDNY